MGWIEMDPLEASRELFRVANEATSLFIRCEPPEPDYTIHEGGVIWLQAPTGEAAQFPFDRDTFPILAAMLKSAIGKECVVFGWNFKHLVTMHRVYVGKEDFLKAKIFDIRLIEHLCDIWIGKCPQTFQEAFKRFRVAATDPYWKKVYAGIQTPLMLKVIPAIETCGLIDTEARRSVYPYYDIEGQKNGRLKAITDITKVFNPHNMGDDPRYKPRGADDRFLLFDYKHMEVSTLAWISQDPALLKLVHGKRDVFLGIWEAITGEAADAESRTICKLLFLPVCYGFGPANLAKKLEVSENSAKELIYRVRQCFPVADQYLHEKQESIKEDGVLRDHFGRLRIFQEKVYTCRNFLIQSPAATICHEKLIRLHESLEAGTRIAFNVHDGYALVTPVSTIQDVLKSCKEVLEAESNLAPGLKLRVTAKAGVRLDKLIQCPAR